MTDRKRVYTVHKFVKKSVNYLFNYSNWPQIPTNFTLSEQIWAIFDKKVILYFITLVARHHIIHFSHPNDILRYYPIHARTQDTFKLAVLNQISSKIDTTLCSRFQALRFGWYEAPFGLATFIGPRDSVLQKRGLTEFFEIYRLKHKQLNIFACTAWCFGSKASLC